MSQLFALPSVGVALIFILRVPSGSVSMYSSFLDPGVILTLMVSDDKRGNCMRELYPNHCRMQIDQIIELTLLTGRL